MVEWFEKLNDNLDSSLEGSEVGNKMLKVKRLFTVISVYVVVKKIS